MKTGFTSGETRETTCGCQATFTQHRLSDRFLNAAASVAHREGKSLPAVAREIPDGFVPTMCPTCERKALTETHYRREPWLLEKVRRSVAPREPVQPPDTQSYRDRQFAAD